MHRGIIVPGVLASASLLPAIPASAASPSPGAPGIGDPCYPDYGNGGYDVSPYDLRLTYRSATDELEGTATLLARTTQDLSRFNLDFLLDVSEVRVNGVRASFTTSGEHELEITPGGPLPGGTDVTVVVRYRGVPSSKEAYGFTGWPRTPDGGVAANEPEADFRRYAEEVSGKPLAALFDTWLYRASRPEGAAARAASVASAASGDARAAGG
ncbi:hypothetical protein ACPF8X_35820, partial [Streptomyces sp. G35A]